MAKLVPREPGPEPINPPLTTLSHFSHISNGYILIGAQEEILDIHFWEDRGSKWDLSTVLSSDDLDDPRNTLRAWEDVAKHAFPSNNIYITRPVSFAVHWEPFITPEGDLEREKAYAIVVQPGQIRHNTANPQQRLYERSHRLIIEVKPPAQDTPEGWKELMLQACSRVRQHQYDHGAHDVFIICTTGLKYMPFYWDPSNADKPTQELCLNVAGEDEHFPSQLTPIPDCSPHVPNLKTEGSPDQYRIDLGQLWSADPEQLDTQGKATEPLTALENFLTTVRTTPLKNPRTRLTELPNRDPNPNSPVLEASCGVIS